MEYRVHSHRDSKIEELLEDLATVGIFVENYSRCNISNWSNPEGG